jgi:hypothetical protein
VAERAVVVTEDRSPVERIGYLRGSILMALEWLDGGAARVMGSPDVGRAVRILRDALEEDDTQ